MKPTSLDLRKRIVAARNQDGQSMGQIAERFRISKGTVQNILERYRDAGTVEPAPQNAGRKRALNEDVVKKLEEQVLLRPDATLKQLRDACALSVSLVTVHNYLKRMGYTLKKRAYTRASKSGMM